MLPPAASARISYVTLSRRPPISEKIVAAHFIKNTGSEFTITLQSKSFHKVSKINKKFMHHNYERKLIKKIFDNVDMRPI